MAKAATIPRASGKPPRPRDPNVSRLDDRAKTAIRGHCSSRIETMRGYRLSFWAHWARLAEMYLPRRYKWFVTPNNQSRGSPMNQSMVDETGMLAARMLSTALLSGLTSPNKPWFALGIAGQDDLPEGPVQVWLSECTKRMLEVYSGSNIYQALGVAYHDNVVFGSAAMMQYEHPERVVHFRNYCLGEFFFGLDNWLQVDTLATEFTYTIKETVDEFGLENVSESTRLAYQTAANLDTEIVIQSIVEPNGPVYLGGQQVPPILPSRFKFREVFWEQASSQGGNQGGHLLRIKGYLEKPQTGLRWDVTSNDAYGRSPGMDGLPATLQIQIEQRRKAEAIDKMVRPPMVASPSMKNEPMDILPGGVTYTNDPNAGFKPAFQVEPRISEMTEDLKEVQSRIQRVFFNDVVAPITSLQTVRSATEIDNRVQEALVQIGPVIERTENEGLDEIIQRTFAIMWRRKMFPPPPAELANLNLSIKYVSLFAEVQRAAATTAIEKFSGFVGQWVAVQQNAVDNVDVDELIEEYANALTVNPKVLRGAGQLAILRQQRAQQEQAASAAQTGTALAAGAQTLSQTPVGGGQSALSLMLGREAA